MPSATASGADAGSNGNAKSREHNQGNQDRKYTVEQKAAVIRIRKCAPTAFYEILGIEKTVSEGEVKKSYRKLSLLTHPDKNGYEGADEAFKMVSRAFQILSDADKKAKYDRFGGDPDNRFGSSSAAPSSPFSGFASSPAGGGGRMYEDEMTAEELFSRFFGGGMGGAFGGGGGMFDTGGPQFVFNLGGGPGLRVHQFGGNRPRRRPRDATTNEETTPQNAQSMLMNLLPLLIIFILPLLSSIFSSTELPGPSFRFETPAPPYTMPRKMPRIPVDYYVIPEEVKDFTPSKLKQLDQKAKDSYSERLRYDCALEEQGKNRMMQDAQGWLFPDWDKVQEANALPLKSCNRMRELGIRKTY